MTQYILPIMSVLIPILFGVVLCIGLFGKLRQRSGYWLTLSLAPGFGLAITSVIYFFWIYLFQPNYALDLYIALEISLLILVTLLCVVLWLRNKNVLNSVDMETRVSTSKYNYFTWISVAGGLILFVGVIIFLNKWRITSIALPDGNWDAWAIWNLRARFIFSGVHWKDGFTNLVSWTHPDYPLLLPGSIARIWGLIGSRTQLVPIYVNLLFTLSILAVLLSGLAFTRGWKTAVFAGLFCLPILHISLSFTQYADLPIAFFFLAANLLLFIADVQPGNASPHMPDAIKQTSHLILTNVFRKVREFINVKSWVSTRKEKYSIFVLVGLAIGAGLWTKSEGWAFLVAFGISEIGRVWIVRPRLQDLIKRWFFVFIGFLPLLIAALVYQNVSDLQSNLLDRIQGQDIIAKLVDLSRYGLILKELIQQFLTYGIKYLPLLPVLIIYLLLVGINLRKSERIAILTLAIRMGAVALIYLAIYVMTPYPLQWHLDTSLSRLVSQLCPSLILLVFLASRSVEDYEGRVMNTP